MGHPPRTYSFGLERISETQTLNSVLATNFYGYDGHGSVRQLTNTSGTVTDTYDYDAFGNPVNSTGSTPNNFMFAGEQYDPALGLYYNRARYLNTTTGRFWSMDTQQGNDREPLSLHKYLYSEGNPVDHMDPSGNQIDDLVGSFALDATLNAISNIQLPGGSVSSFVATQLIPSDVLQGLAQGTPDAALAAASGQVNLNLNNPFAGATGYAGFELLGSLKTGRGALYGDVGAGLALGGTASGGSASGMVGLVFNCPNSADYTQNFVSVTVPLGALASGTIAKIETELVQVSVAGFGAGVPTAYISIISELSSISVSGTFSADKAVTVFYAPFKNPDGSRPFGFSLGSGASLSLGPQQSSWAVGSWSYYWQLLPSETVPFE